MPSLSKLLVLSACVAGTLSAYVDPTTRPMISDDRGAFAKCSDIQDASKSGYDSLECSCLDDVAKETSGVHLKGDEEQTGEKAGTGKCVKEWIDSFRGARGGVRLPMKMHEATNTMVLAGWRQRYDRAQALQDVVLIQMDVDPATGEMDFKPTLSTTNGDYKTECSLQTHYKEQGISTAPHDIAITKDFIYVVTAGEGNGRFMFSKVDRRTCAIEHRSLASDPDLPNIKNVLVDKVKAVAATPVDYMTNPILPAHMDALVEALDRPLIPTRSWTLLANHDETQLFHNMRLNIFGGDPALAVVRIPTDFSNATTWAEGVELGLCMSRTAFPFYHSHEMTYAGPLATGKDYGKIFQPMGVGICMLKETFVTGMAQDAWYPLSATKKDGSQTDPLNQMRLGLSWTEVTQDEIDHPIYGYTRLTEDFWENLLTRDIAGAWGFSNEPDAWDGNGLSAEELFGESYNTATGKIDKNTNPVFIDAILPKLNKTTYYVGAVDAYAPYVPNQDITWQQAEWGDKTFLSDLELPKLVNPTKASSYWIPYGVAEAQAATPDKWGKTLPADWKGLPSSCHRCAPVWDTFFSEGRTVQGCAVFSPSETTRVYRGRMFKPDGTQCDASAGDVDGVNGCARDEFDYATIGEDGTSLNLYPDGTPIEEQYRNVLAGDFPYCKVHQNAQCREDLMHLYGEIPEYDEVLWSTSIGGGATYVRCEPRLGEPDAPTQYVYDTNDPAFLVVQEGGKFSDIPAFPLRVDNVNNDPNAIKVSNKQCGPGSGNELFPNVLPVGGVGGDEDHQVAGACVCEDNFYADTCGAGKKAYVTIPNTEECKCSQNWLYNGVLFHGCPTFYAPDGNCAWGSCCPSIAEGGDGHCSAVDGVKPVCQVVNEEGCKDQIAARGLSYEWGANGNDIGWEYGGFHLNCKNPLDPQDPVHNLVGDVDAGTISLDLASAVPVPDAPEIFGASKRRIVPNGGAQAYGAKVVGNKVYFRYGISQSDQNSLGARAVTSTRWGTYGVNFMGATFATSYLNGEDRSVAGIAVINLNSAEEQAEEVLVRELESLTILKSKIQVGYSTEDFTVADDGSVCLLGLTSFERFDENGAVVHKDSKMVVSDWDNTDDLPDLNYGTQGIAYGHGIGNIVVERFPEGSETSSDYLLIDVNAEVNTKVDDPHSDSTIDLNDFITYNTVYGSNEFRGGPWASYFGLRYGAVAGNNIFFTDSASVYSVNTTAGAAMNLNEGQVFVYDYAKDYNGGHHKFEEPLNTCADQRRLFQHSKLQCCTNPDKKLQGGVDDSEHLQCVFDRDNSQGSSSRRLSSASNKHARTCATNPESPKCDNGIEM